jgi:hypothetical protein
MALQSDKMCIQLINEEGSVWVVVDDINLMSRMSSVHYEQTEEQLKNQEI